MRTLILTALLLISLPLLVSADAKSREKKVNNIQKKVNEDEKSETKADLKPSPTPRKSVDAGKPKEPKDKRMVEGNEKHTAPRVNVDVELARVKKEIQKIQAKPISNDKKLKELQALRDREMGNDPAPEIKSSIKKCIDSAKETSQSAQALGR
jgi:cell division septation protein DedD